MFVVGTSSLDDHYNRQNWQRNICIVHTYHTLWKRGRGSMERILTKSLTPKGR